MRRNPRCRPGTLVLAASLLAALATATFAQDWKGRGRLQGRVVTEEGEPIEGVTVTLRVAGQPDAGPPPIQTDKKGRWSFLGLGNGQWTVLIEHPEYITSEGTVPVSEFNPNRKPIETALRSLQELIDQEAAKRAAELKAKLEEANRLLGEERYADARTEFENALESVDEASQPMVLIAIARTHYAEENADATIATLERALAISPDNVEALQLISSLLVSEGRTEEAQQYIARLPSEAKLDPNALLNVGIDKYNAGDLEGALAEFDTVVESYAEFAEAYYYRGLTHLGLTNNEPALADLERFLELAPEHGKAGEAEQFLEYLRSQ